MCSLGHLESMECSFGHMHMTLQDRRCCRHQGNGCYSKGTSPKCFHGKLGRAHKVTQHATGIAVNEQKQDSCQEN